MSDYEEYRVKRDKRDRAEKRIKKIGFLLILIGVIGIGKTICSNVFLNYHYEKEISYHWSLADKSSTILAKKQHIEQFVSAIESNRNKFADYDAIFLKTPDNCFNDNFLAIKTLSERLNTISKMDEKDFAYQTAIQQITQQEQGEAQKLLGVISGCYALSNAPSVWRWICWGIVGFSLLFLCIGLAMVLPFP